MIKFYQLEKCGTCRKAVKFLDARRIPYKSIALRETPPSKAELKQMLASVGGEVRKLFNTSGLEYKRLSLKEKLGKLSTEEALDLLAGNGSLVKRPFLIGEGVALIGFKEAEWAGDNRLALSVR